MAPAFDDTALLFARHGSARYSGEPVTHTEHALRTAWLAEQSDADDELITAALLQDLGQLLHEHGGPHRTRHRRSAPVQGAAFPALFGETVIDAMRWHVDAKRYLCVTRPEYQAALSADSQRSLMLQGGMFSAAEAQAFIARPHAADAVRLRLWDEQAKTEGLPTPGMDHYLAIAARCRLPAPAHSHGRERLPGAALLFPALLHASWNALIKSGGDKSLDTALILGLGVIFAVPQCSGLARRPCRPGLSLRPRA